ncbi:5-deoxy-glucuronate isomerase [Actinacidiphila rubida]|uniref:5-deoxyglucuronate isomerase n=1 Tax=Actinacidiphila rubida TaxID=310780 RepID=A0A1H8EKD8_9ACTN|nr:5-deoxy-glucuronate isomerase [Actinacidiphila rubida]SEN19268.1 5-deoxyglucuronate isomerase [Actinacidiphila rubida]
MTDDPRWVLPHGTAGAGGWDLAVTDAHPGWQHTSLHTARLAGDETRTLAADAFEHLVVPLSGAVHVTAETAGGQAHRIGLDGRADVFAGPTDVAYVPAGARLTLRAAGGAPARVAVAGALAPGSTGRAVHRVPAAAVPVERRGAGGASREVRNFGTPAVLDAESVIACEVVTPAGNWSSWPPHKHDAERPGEETALEEIYYFETQGTDARCTDPVGYQRVYASRADRPIDVLAEVRTGDAVLVPHGWHGPSMAAADAHLYYLNVMAGPGPERAWLICDDPAHAWVRETWPDQPFDPRLPLADPAGTRPGPAAAPATKETE